jgi:RNA polymerase sigma-70 factor (sigma-E family)
MNKAEEAEFREYVASRLESWRRAAFLMCRDWHGADDLVGITLGRLYRHWSRACQADSMDAYVHGMLAHAFLDERRRPWRREHSDTAAMPERATLETGTDGIHDRADMLTLIRQLPARRRAVVVLRFYCDLSVGQTAEALGLSEGTVKSQCARALDTLRKLTTSDGRAEK